MTNKKTGFFGENFTYVVGTGFYSKNGAEFSHHSMNHE